ncbi:MAG: NTP transferase domain-containing protein [Candidatus Omnitrophica bacterium]|nr:NTP transferase domain-containing protein [Candidatus Omnitrophota bacterium]
MQAVILAGGAGTRLYPLTRDIPKAMIDINGRPFLLRVVEALKRGGIKDFVFCAGHLAGQIKVFFGDGAHYGVHIAYSVEKEFMGTGGALKMAKRYLENDFFVVNGDTYLPVNYASVYKSFQRCGKAGLIVLYDNHEKIAEPNIAVNARGIVTGYVKMEKLKRGDQEMPLNNAAAAMCRFIDAGVQVFKKEILGFIPPGRFSALETDVFPELIKREELASRVVSQRYYDIGTPQRLRLARKMFKDL